MKRVLTALVMSKRTSRRFDAICAVLAISSAVAEAIQNEFTTASRFDTIFWPAVAAYWCLLWWLTTRRRTR